jgi:hypothetical protein
MNMSEKIIPVFSGVENQTASEALSEPFVKAEEFSWAHPQTSQYIGPFDTDKLAAIGTSYIGDNGQTKFIYAMHPFVQAPYAAAQAFMTAYGSLITPNHAQSDKTHNTLGLLGDDGLEHIKSSAGEHVKKAQLKTIGSFVVFASEESGDFTAGFAVSNAIIDDLPLQSREELFQLEQRGPEFMQSLGVLAGVSEETNKRVAELTKQNRDQLKYSLFAAALHMPRIVSLRRTIDEHPFVSDFASLPRKAKRELLRTEQRSLGRQES